MAEKLTTANALRETTFEELTFGAGIMVKSFNPETLDIGEILWATSDGLAFTDTPSYEDFGADIDNCPDNTKELKRIVGREVKISGTALTITADIIKRLVGAADASDAVITPRDTLKDEDFEDVWVLTELGDDKIQYIHLKDTLNTSGYSLNTTKNAKGTFPFELTAHYSIAKKMEVPYEIGIVDIA